MPVNDVSSVQLAAERVLMGADAPRIHEKSLSPGDEARCISSIAGADTTPARIDVSVTPCSTSSLSACKRANGVRSEHSRTSNQIFVHVAASEWPWSKERAESVTGKRRSASIMVPSSIEKYFSSIFSLPAVALNGGAAPKAPVSRANNGGA